MITATAATPRIANRTKRARSGLSMNARSGARGAADDAREDDEADAVADPLLGDQLAQPHQGDRCPAVRVTIWVSVSQLPRSNGGAEHAVRRQERQQPVRLEQRHRHRQVARVLVDLGAAVLTLALQRLERGDDARHELHDDRGVDVRVHAQRHDREVRQAAAREQVEQPEDRVRAQELLELRRVDARDRDVREHPEDQQDPGDEQDPAPEVRRAERVEQALEHGR